MPEDAALADGSTSAVSEERLALCLSGGGGLRAAFFHMGTIWALREAGLLNRVGEIYSVSGGSVLAALVVQNWKRISGTEADFHEAVKKALAIGARDLRGRVVRRWFMTWPTAFLPSRLDALKIGPIELLVAQYRSIFGRITFFNLYDGNEGAPYLYLLATSFLSGEMCTFSKEGCFVEGKGGIQIPYDSIEIASAVAASSAFPALFPPFRLKRAQLDADVLQMPVSPHPLADGGVYDNLGFEKAILMHEQGRSKATTILVSDAGSTFDWDVESAFYWPISRAVRAVDILMNRVALNTVKKI
jgi:predicted acylesterase/phospholipase RssA